MTGSALLTLVETWRDAAFAWWDSNEDIGDGLYATAIDAENAVKLAVREQAAMIERLRSVVLAELDLTEAVDRMPDDPRTGSRNMLAAEGSLRRALAAVRASDLTDETEA